MAAPPSGGSDGSASDAAREGGKGYSAAPGGKAPAKGVKGKGKGKGIPLGSLGKGPSIESPVPVTPDIVNWVLEYDPRRETISRVAALEGAGPNIRSCSMGYDHTAVVNAQGEVFCKGDNTYGQLGTGDIVQQRGLIRAKVPWPASKVSSGNVFTVALKADGKAVATWGWDNTGRLGRGRLTVYHAPPGEVGGLPSGAKVTIVAAGYDYVLVATAAGEVYGWGYNGNGTLALGEGAPRVVHTPVRVEALCGRQVRNFACGERFATAETEANELLCWGHLGGTFDPLPVPIQPGTGAMAFPLRSFGAGGRCIAAADHHGNLWVVPADARAPSKVDLPGRPQIARVGVANAGGKAVVAITADGELWDVRSPGHCRNISGNCPGLPRWLIPHGGSMGECILLTPDRSAGKPRLRLLLLISARRKLLPTDAHMRRMALCAMFVSDHYVFDVNPERTLCQVAEAQLQIERHKAHQLELKIAAFKTQTEKEKELIETAEDDRNHARESLEHERDVCVHWEQQRREAEEDLQRQQDKNRRQHEVLERLADLLQQNTAGSLDEAQVLISSVLPLGPADLV
eukprot:TRINITY_DN1659_c0_g2_i1.p1 TRINITY_DN1659_c0_g2~~TRINITY_DN1659_c0_g2_i1.p1  ORF type:complete len:598 (+),score=191.63 TRINITY_DN1659_c0_g2_i1:80-1795(+)